MIEKVKAYFEALEKLSTEKLDRSVDKLVRAEKRSVGLVIAHVAEMSRRKGYLELGYKNLFDYCVRRLRLSEGSVALRIQVANVSRRFPQLLVALAENRLSLTVAGLLAPVLTESNVEKLLGDCVGMTKREAEEYLVALRPKLVFAPSIRKAPTTAPRVQAPPPVQTPPTHTPRPTPRVSPAILEPARPEVDIRRFQLPLRREPRVQGEVRASGGSPRSRKPLAAYGRDHGPGFGYRTRQKRSEEKARTATTEGVER